MNETIKQKIEELTGSAEGRSADSTGILEVLQRVKTEINLEQEKENNYD
jgi:hypothetical protein